MIHHTDCGMEYFKDDELAELLAGSLETAELTPAGFRNAGTDCSLLVTLTWPIIVVA